MALACRALAEAELAGVAATQRDLAKRLGVSLGKANQFARQVLSAGHAQTGPGPAAGGGTRPLGMTLTPAGRDYLDQFKVTNAIVLAAGFGSRFVPITLETPKGLIEVHGEPMLERQLRQLQEAGITEIILVVGYMKERFEYLVDKFGVKLVFNPEYSTKNNLASLHCVREHLSSSYVLVADNWIESNMFHRWEPDTWLSGLYFAGPTSEWVVTFGPKDLIKGLHVGGRDAWAILGPAHFTPRFSERFRALMEEAYATPGTEDWYWEHVLKANLRQLPAYLNRLGTTGVREFESLAELREFDHSYRERTNSTIMRQIARALDTSESQITVVESLHNSSTGANFRFAVNGREFVYRIPHEGANRWIDRGHERSAYAAVSQLGFTDEVIWLDPVSGHRITSSFPSARRLDPSVKTQVEAAVRGLRRVHSAPLKILAQRDLTADIQRLRALRRPGGAIRFFEHDQFAALAEELAFIPDAQEVRPVLVHGSFAPSNVLILSDQRSPARIVDWELAGMGDPLIDVARFALSAEYAWDQVHAFTTLYLGHVPSEPERRRLYRWIALNALVEALWAEYRQPTATKPDEYPPTMYRYAKEYGRWALARDLPGVFLP
ncbi:MAG: NTP transferase domain-containing protein [Bifidobacteriaceae bacterium]|jgi:CTP:phosphocholine cytidylyltransferase-like protein/thiamine kinase-like enzyme|nr:NTP transferase domain-containing protein [Bifidobacteriaceae bacterium]